MLRAAVGPIAGLFLLSSASSATAETYIIRRSLGCGEHGPRLFCARMSLAEQDLARAYYAAFLDIIRSDLEQFEDRWAPTSYKVYSEWGKVIVRIGPAPAKPSAWSAERAAVSYRDAARAFDRLFSPAVIRAEASVGRTAEQLGKEDETWIDPSPAVHAFIVRFPAAAAAAHKVVERSRAEDGACLDLKQKAAQVVEQTTRDLHLIPESGLAEVFIRGRAARGADTAVARALGSDPTSNVDAVAWMDETNRQLDRCFGRPVDSYFVPTEKLRPDGPR